MTKEDDDKRIADMGARLGKLMEHQRAISKAMELPIAVFGIDAVLEYAEGYKEFEEERQDLNDE